MQFKAEFRRVLSSKECKL